MDWIDHERAKAGLPARDDGRSYTGVQVYFYAEHDDPAGIKPRHGHTWFVKAWFPEGRDAREVIKPVEAIADELRDTFVSGLWGEGIGRAFGKRLEGCVAVDVWRDDEPFSARWVR